MTAGPAVDALIAAWIEWERVAAKTPKRPPDRWLKAETDRKVDAITALGLQLIEMCDFVASRRRHGWSVPDAVQAAFNEFSKPDSPQNARMTRENVSAPGIDGTTRELANTHTGGADMADGTTAHPAMTCGAA